MARLNYHPSPGFGDLPENWHIVPPRGSVPYTRGTPLVPSVQGTMPGRIIRRGSLRDLMAGGFTVPQNPLRMALGDLMAGGFTVPQNPIIPGMGRLGCGCNSGCGSQGTANYTLNGLRGLGGGNPWRT